MSQSAHPMTQLVHSTVRIECINRNGQKSSGTGYIFMFCEHDKTSIPCVVTNKHVVRGAIQATFHLTLMKEDRTPDLGKHEQVVLKNLSQHCINHPSAEIDLVAFPIGPILVNAEKDGSNYHIVPIDKKLLANKSLLDSLSPMEEIAMIGYPNGLWDKVHNLPIIRKGVTATHPGLNLNGKSEFLIDAACFPGSSGSPVFLVNIGVHLDHNGSICMGNRIALLGTLYAGPQHTTEGEIIIVDVPTDTKPIAVSSIPNNLGYVIHASELLVLEEEIKKAIEPQPLTPRNSPCACHSGKRYKDCCGNLRPHLKQGA